MVQNNTKLGPAYLSVDLFIYPCDFFSYTAILFHSNNIKNIAAARGLHINGVSIGEASKRKPVKSSTNNADPPSHTQAHTSGFLPACVFEKGFANTSAIRV